MNELDEGLYNISAILENAVFKNESGKQLKVEELRLEDRRVGWFSG